MRKRRIILALSAFLFPATASAETEPATDAATIQARDLEDLDEAAIARLVLGAVAARSEQRGAVGSATEDRSSLALISFDLAPYYSNGLCGYDRLLVWFSAAQAGQTLRERDDPPVLVRSVETRHYFADPESSPQGNDFYHFIACPIPRDDPRFFEAENRDTAQRTISAVTQMRAGIRDDGPIYAFECQDPSHGADSICDDPIALLRGFAFRRATVSDDNDTIVLTSPGSDDRLILHMQGYSISRAVFVRPEPIIVT
jgi:hypothetical protein